MVCTYSPELIGAPSGISLSYSLLNVLVRCSESLLPPFSGIGQLLAVLAPPAIYTGVETQRGQECVPRMRIEYQFSAVAGLKLPSL